MNAPGRADRKGVSLMEAAELFSDPQRTEEWFVKCRWPNGVRCPVEGCESPKIHMRKNRRPQPFLCLDCRKDFSVKTDTIMHSSKLPLGKWGMAFYLFSTNLKGVSSMKLHRDLGVTQKTAWHMAHRIRETWDKSPFRFSGNVEADETYIGGKEGNKHANKKLRAGRGTVGKFPVVGMKERESKQIKAAVLERTDKHRLQGFVHAGTAPDAVVHTDEAPAYNGLMRRHESVKHSAGEYVRGMCHTNGIESFWATMKRGYNGVYHNFSRKHCHRYVNEFAGRHNARPMDTLEQMAAMVFGSVGKRLRYEDLIAEPARLI